MSYARLLSSSLVVLATLAAAAPAHAAPILEVSPSIPAVTKWQAAYLLNPSFDDPTPGITPGDPADTLAVCVGATGQPSASENWSTWTNTVRTQISSWLTDSPDGLYTVNLVYAGGFADGLVQVLSKHPEYYVPLDVHATNVNYVGVWVWVVAGQVGVQLGDGGAAGGVSHMSETNGVWEYISGCGRADGLNNEVTIYAAGPAIYYVDDASVEYDPSCAGKY
jgi:hypothetical protein